MCIDLCEPYTLLFKLLIELLIIVMQSLFIVLERSTVHITFKALFALHIDQSKIPQF